MLYLVDMGSRWGTSERVQAVGRFIRERRKSQGLSQVELAERADVSVTFIIDLENGSDRGYQLDKLNRVLELFGHFAGPVPLNSLDIHDA